jgi:hypothetical protein
MSCGLRSRGWVPRSSEIEPAAKSGNGDAPLPHCRFHDSQRLSSRFYFSVKR